MLGNGLLVCQNPFMSTVTIQLSDPLDASITERMKDTGAQSREEYLLRLVESDCAAGTLERILSDRIEGPFAPLEPDWMDKVRARAATCEN